VDRRLPAVFFDQPLAGEHRDLVEGRARVIGPDDAALGQAEALVVSSARRWDAAALRLAPQCRVISRWGTGYDNVDVAAAAAAGIVVCHTPDAPTVSTAEHTLALLLAITKDLPARMAVAAAGLPGGPPFALELEGCTLGLVGLGRIARRVAIAASAFGMRVIAHDPYLDGDMVASDVAVDLVPFDELLASADVVSLHAPATGETRHLIDARSLALAKPGVYIVNCARGSLIDQSALLAALETGRVAGAALDVTDPEPLPVGHPLLMHPRVIVTPHVASSTAVGRRRLVAGAIDNALAVLDGRPATLVPTSVAPGR
jgi:D-3-phosphoglycerate dehydrogenase / 2-oxoglutarate reductase